MVQIQIVGINIEKNHYKNLMVVKLYLLLRIRLCLGG